MTHPTSPTMPRYQLGQELKALRVSAGLSLEDAAQVLKCSVAKIRRVEGGKVGLRLGDLFLLLDAYKVEDPSVRAVLMELQEQGNQRGWWSKLGLPEATARLLGFESSASSVRFYEQWLVPGLLQTEAYARAAIRAITAPICEAELDRAVGLRLERQERALKSANPPKLWVILDEAVIRRAVGGPAVMREQLEYLLEGPYPYTLQVVPFSAGAHAGGVGAFWIFDFPPNTRTSVVYVEAQAGNLYLSDGAEVERATLSYNQLRATASGEESSRQFVADAMKELSA